MHARTAELTAYLDRHHATMRGAVDAVPRAHRDEAPAPDCWSVANVLEHVALVEYRVASGLTRPVAEARAGLTPAVDTTVVSTADLSRYFNRDVRRVATEAARPKAGLDADAAWVSLDQAREATGRLLRDTDGLDLSPVSMPHPLFGLLNAYQWIIFLGGHEGRHALQIQDVGRALADRR